MVAENITVSGGAGKLNGWNYLYIDPARIQLIEG